MSCRKCKFHYLPICEATNWAITRKPYSNDAKLKKNLTISSIKTEFIMLFFGKCCSSIVRQHTSKKNIYCLIGQQGTSSRPERLTISGNLAVDVFGRGTRRIFARQTAYILIALELNKTLRLSGG